jgi:hypothetical protein
MSEKELNEYLNASLEVRYSIHKDYYFKEYPESNIEKFHKFEAAFLQREISKYNTQKKVLPKETEIYLSQIEVLEYINSLSSTLPPQQAEAKPKKLTAPIISLFCTLINDSKTIIRTQNENAENYCRRICAQFDLPYTDRVRQNFDGKSNTKKNRQNLRNMLLPNIEAETQIKLQHYLDTKHPTEQNLYG